jgi:zinc protease
MAHLFEHLMFKETKNLKEGEFDRLMELRGASTNAATFLDWTFFHEELGTAHLDFCLGVEADRMANMVLEDHQLETEREVVKNERLLRTENDPEGAMYEVLYENAYTTHAYQWPVIGRKPDLDAIELSDCLDFYRTFYAPNNAVLVLVGDLQEEETLALVEKHYGKLPAAKLPASQPSPEPPQEQERRLRLVKPISSEMALIAYHVPGYTHPDLPALEIANAVLFDGPSSRLERRLSADLQLVTRVEGWMPGTKDPGLWETFLCMREGVPLFRVEAEIYEAFDLMGRDLISQEELDRAKSKLEAGFYRGLREATDKAYQLGFHEVVAEDFEALIHSMERWARVTREDVREVCERVLRRQGRTVVHAVPVARNHAQRAKGSGQVDLPKGARLFREVSSDLPLVSYRMLTRSGALLDPPGKEGLTYLTLEMLSLGTQNRTREDFEEAVDRLGGVLRSYAGRLTTSFGGEVPVRNFTAFRALLEEAILHPAFQEIEFQKLRSRTQSELSELQNEDGRLVSLYLRNHLFPEHLFGRDPRGTRASLEGLTLKDVRAHYGRMLRTGSIALAAAGDLDSGELEESACTLLEAISEGKAPALPEPPPPTTGGRRLLLVNKPDRSQIHYSLGHRGVRAGDPEWIPLKVAETAFGGTFTSLLMQELRVKTGWSYGAYSSNSRARLEDLYVQVAYPSAEDGPACIARHLELYEAHCRGEITQEALEAAKEYLINRYPFSFETAGKRLDRLMEPFFLDISEDYWESYQEQIRAVTLEKARDAAKRHRSSQDLSLVVVCTAKGFEERLREAGLHFAEVEVRDYRSLL